MYSISVEVAGHCIAFYGPRALLSPFASALAPFLSHAPAAWSVEILQGLPEQAEFPSEDWIVRLRNYAVGLCLQQKTGRAVLTRWEGLWGILELVLQVALLPSCGLIFHACGAVYRGEGWLCFGPSESGKSTAGQNGGFDLVLSDERAVVLPDGDGFRLWSTPFWSQTSEIRFVQASAPLCYLGWLQKDLRPHFDLKPKDEMVALLLSCVHFYETSYTACAQVFDAACKLAESVMGGALFVPRNGPWLDAVLRTISKG